MRQLEYELFLFIHAAVNRRGTPVGIVAARLATSTCAATQAFLLLLGCRGFLLSLDFGLELGGSKLDKLRRFVEVGEHVEHDCLVRHLQELQENVVSLDLS